MSNQTQASAQKPTVLEFRGSIGRLPDAYLDRAFIVRTVGGCDRFLDANTVPAMLHAIIRMRELIPEIKKVRLCGPWRFVPRNEVYDYKSALRYFSERLWEIKRIVEASGLGVTVEVDLDEPLTRKVDWSEPPAYKTVLTTCVDYRLGRFLRELREQHRRDLLILRWTGATAGFTHPIFLECLLRQFEIVQHSNACPIENFLIRPHQDCAVFGGSKPHLEEEVMIHRNNYRWARNQIKNFCQTNHWPLPTGEFWRLDGQTTPLST